MKSVTLPLEEAVELATKENIERDLRRGVIDAEDVEEERSVYREEAEHVLITTGENYLPEYAAHHRIFLKRD